VPKPDAVLERKLLSTVARALGEAGIRLSDSAQSELYGLITERVSQGILTSETAAAEAAAVTTAILQAAEQTGASSHQRVIRRSFFAQVTKILLGY
jgi:hypothetical protein